MVRGTLLRKWSRRDSQSEGSLVAGWYEQAAPCNLSNDAYNMALKKRGSLTVWFDLTMTWEGQTPGGRGRRPSYSDAAIQTCLTLKVLFGMALRQVTGFVENLLHLVGLTWSVPDFSTLIRSFKRPIWAGGAECPVLVQSSECRTFIRFAVSFRSFSVETRLVQNVGFRTV